MKVATCKTQNGKNKVKHRTSSIIKGTGEIDRYIFKYWI